MTITQIQLLSVPVTDQDRAKAFYVDKLGFELVRDVAMGPAQRWVQLAPKGAETSITLVTWFDSMPAGSLGGLVLETDDLDRDVADLAGRGVPTSEVEDAPWGRYVTLNDPDGNSMVLQTTRARR
ncbi:MAG TPA: VOC family protein [Mycobacteriales bacterium]|nr:VOC family protein [Mycobacteriales bacterium]